MQVVNKVRGQLSSLERKILSALIVVDVHARDVAAELASKGVTSETDFDFVSQLRYGPPTAAHGHCAKTNLSMFAASTIDIIVVLLGAGLAVHRAICACLVCMIQHSCRR
jgi:hypothetical protein